MNGGHLPSVAAIEFPSAREASQRIAGVAVVARIVRELAVAGFASVWLRLPDGEAFDAAAMSDVERLAGHMTLQIGPPPVGKPVARIPADRLIPADAIEGFLAASGGDTAAVIDLTRRDAGAEILRRTGKATDGPVSRWFNRPVSRTIAALLLTMPQFRPVHATVGTALLALAMFAAMVFGGEFGLIAGGLLFQAASVFDGVDGEIARATFRASQAGAKLDTAIDTMTTLLFLVGLTINLASSGYGHAVGLATWGIALFLLGLLLIAWHGAKDGGALNFLRIKRHYRRRFSNPLLSGFMAFATVVSSRDFFALFFATLILLGWPMGVLYVFAVAASIWFPFVAASLLPPRKEAMLPEERLS